MIKGVRQCCFTNTVNDADPSSKGFNTLATFGDLTQDILQKCAKIHGENGAQTAQALDEANEILNLFEIDGDEDFIYLTRTQYGLSDHMNRPGIFSHTYILPWEDRCLSDPNTFLSIDDSNFKTTAQEAVIEQEDFVRQPDFELQSTLDELDIDEKEYVVLVKCVYSKLVLVKGSSPLYVQYDGTPEQMRKILFCIYRGIPHYLRKKITVSSCDTSNKQDKTLVFSINARSHQLYIDPSNAENSIMTPKNDKIINKDGYITAVVENYKKMESGESEYTMESYFDALENKAAEFGDESHSSRLVMRIANSRLSGKRLEDMNQIELSMLLMDMLSVSISFKEPYYEFMADVFEESQKKGASFTPEMESMLEQALDNTENERLRMAYREYKYKQFVGLSKEVAAEKLDKLGSAALKEHLQMLQNDDRGEDILVYYYLNYRLNSSMTWEMIRDIIIEIQDLKGIDLMYNQEISSALFKKMNELCAGGISRHDPNVFLKYEALLQSMKLSAGEIVDELEKQKDAFWKLTSFGRLDLGLAVNNGYYEPAYMQSANINCEMFKAYISLAEKDVKDVAGYVESVYQFFTGYAKTIDGEQSLAVKKLVDYLVDKYGEFVGRGEKEDRNHIGEATEVAAYTGSKIGIRPFKDFYGKIKGITLRSTTYLIR